MSLIPNSWRWQQLKSAITCFLCLIPIVFFFLFNFYLTITIIILWSIFIIKNAYFLPINLSILYARFFFEYLLEKPELLSQLRPLGLDLFNTQLNDYSVAYKEYENKKIQTQLHYLQSFKNKKMSVNERESYEVMEYFMNINAKRENSDEFSYHGYLINQKMGAQLEIISIITKFHRILKLNDAEAYLIRVQRISNAFDQLIEQQIERRRRNIQTPRFILQKAITGLEAFREQLKNEPDQSPLVIAFINKLNDKICSKEKQNDLIDRLLKILKINVCPAYDRLLNTLYEDLSNTKTDHGVWKLPNGDKYYQLCLEYHNTTTMTAENIHELGKKHVERIQNEMRNILKEKQIETWHDFRTSIISFEHNIDQKYENIEENRAKIIDDYVKMIENIDNEMHKYFSPACRPAKKCVVERVPQIKEASLPLAYYYPESLDGKTPGTFYVNLRNIDEIIKFKMNTIAYHEAVPGHHFQMSIAQSLKHLPVFRREIPFTAYAEGWALYTEQLAAEEGFHQSWYSYLGYLDYQLLRSCRLVVDTGIHWKRWSREQTIDYMMENTCMNKEEIITEVERYFINPGQACAYMIGCQTILSLREKAQLALGDKFDLKKFHDAVLLHGSLPLNVLENIIDEYIKEQRKDM
ncbi:unnamed protein product [Adineta steineri]|uniref:DUF885 domain-containing protein n=1 Tax=Adineta steineri TaxID=433720 RepID=A0A813MTM1_9BILA|nr:unnamed protein product [Adineta steineri]CAF4053882.1 unnamed protein product [Adineta steineri]